MSPANVFLNADPNIQLKKHLGPTNLVDTKNHSSWAHKLVIVGTRRQAILDKGNAKKINKCLHVQEYQ